MGPQSLSGGLCWGRSGGTDLRPPRGTWGACGRPAGGYLRRSSRTVSVVGLASWALPPGGVMNSVHESRALRVLSSASWLDLIPGRACCFAVKSLREFELPNKLSNQSGEVGMDVEKADRWLCDQIINYVRDAKHKYAVALEGPWGCGKTRYIENVLGPALKQQGKRMVRVSMFGFEDADDVYQKLGALLIHLEDNNSGKIGKVVKRMVSMVPGTMSAIISKMGVPLRFDVGMKFLIDVVLSEKYVIVFDDVERRSERADDLSLFGAVNELVEGRGQKVIFVTNSVDGEVDKGRPFDREVREKLVWKVFSYEQEIGVLVKEVFGNLKSLISDFDALKCVRVAAGRAACVNVRAMLRAEVFVSELLALEVFKDDGVCVANRKAAFIDLVQFGLMASEARVPKAPDSSSVDKALRIFDSSYLTAQQEYEKSLACSFVWQYFTVCGDGSIIDLNDAVCKYVKMRYPDSEDAQVINGVKAAVASRIDLMSDGDLVPMIRSLVTVIRRRNFSSSLLRDAVDLNMRFLDLGFTDALIESELVKCCEGVLRNNGLDVVEFVHYRGGEFFLSEKTVLILEDLKKYAYGLFCQELGAKVSYLVCVDRSPLKVLEIFQNASLGTIRDYLCVRPEYVAWTFFNLDPEGQEELRRHFYKADFGDDRYGGDLNACIQWFYSLKRALNDSGDGDRLTKMRAGWFVHNIDELLSQYSDRVSETCSYEGDIS